VGILAISFIIVTFVKVVIRDVSHVLALVILVQLIQLLELLGQIRGSLATVGVVGEELSCC
jgi:hypothetical protein